jgi:aminopeptidase N
MFRKSLRKVSTILFASAFGLFVSVSSFAQQQPNTPGRARYDITNYRIEAQLIPEQHLLRAGADITLTAIDATRSLVFEFNGSLKMEKVERDGKPLTNFVQDAVGVDLIGPNIRVDLGEVVPANSSITLRFRWSGALVSPEGGPIPTKRLAYVGEEGSYLMYASRWFPFHDYAADRATSDITIIVPNGDVVAGTSDEAIPPTPPGKDGNTRFRYVQKKPSLIGNFFAGKYITRALKIGNYTIDFYTKLGSENRIESYGETIGKALEFYTKKYGQPDFGNRLVVGQIDDDSLETYSASGIMFLANRLFDPTKNAPDEKLQREVAYQWWGQTVGLKAFDDAWISQGLAEWSAYAYREITLTGGALDNLNREIVERALTFEQQSSIARAPANLDDQSTAYQYIMFYKGSIVFKMLRDTMGKENFDKLLRTFLEQYRGKSASIDDFEKLASQVAGTNLRFFFARWVEGTGVPEFSADYLIIRTRSGKFVARGTVKQTYENLRMPVEVMLRAEGENQNITQTLYIDGQSEDFQFESKGQPTEVVIDPNNRILRISDDLRVTTVARRGIELFKEGNYAEAQQQLEAALKLNRNSSWVAYHLGLLFLEQRNYEQAKDYFKRTLDGDLNPQWLTVWALIKLGNCYDASGDRTRAVDAYQKAEKELDNLDKDYNNAKDAIKKYKAEPYDPKKG